jgi:hypothetical protein
MLTIYSKIYEIQNIILAISSASVYQMDRHLVKYENIDIFNTKLIDKYTKEILKKLKDVLENDTFFKCQMYLKPKKLENGKIKYRPIYVTDFITLSAIFAILNILVYSDSKIQGVKKVNETFGAFPENFYGNIISEDCGKFFEPWMKQYQKYSKVYIDKYSAYNKSRKYEYEFNLDLKNFFPSINPEVIFYMLKSKISKNIDNNDFIQYEKLILKTLMIETDVKDKDLIDRIDISDFVIDCKLKDMENIRFAKGLPQGLPQACLYSNLIMEGISDEYRKTFDGDSIFYVDDSVIFSNLPTDKFTDKLKELQNKIKERFNKYIENGITEENENSSINIYYSFFSKFRNIYEIQFNEDKCNYNLIENDIFIFLNNFLQKKTSRNNDIYNAASDEKDYDGILEDFLFYDDIISKEESFIKEENIKDFINIDEINSYKRKIIRLKKYYHYRHLVAQGYSETEKLEVLIDKEIQDIQKYKQENLFEYLNDGILSPLVGLIYKFLPSNKAKEKIYQLKVIFKKNDLLSVMYYNKLFIYKNIRPNNHCLYDFLTDKLNFFSVQSSDYVYDSVKKIFNNTNNNFPCTKFDFVNHALSTLNIKWTEINKYEMLINNSSKYIREIMNQIFSILFNVDNSTQYTLINKRGHSLYDYQFKILFYIRNKNFDFNKVYSLIKTLSMEDKFIGKKVDPSIVEVIPYFERNVGDIQKINTLLSAHEFVKKIWSNGSKYLYFYTLHDEMHSVKLIQNIDKLLTSISYFELKQEEYFILYLSCYLHDISMVLQKNVEM